jgi:hypothetical protein
MRATEGIDEPTAACVFGVIATVIEDLPPSAARFFQGVTQDGHVRETVCNIDLLSHPPHRAVIPAQPLRIKGGRPVEPTQDIDEQIGLPPANSPPARFPCNVSQGAGGVLGDDLDGIRPRPRSQRRDGFRSPGYCGDVGRPGDVAGLMYLPCRGLTVREPFRDADRSAVAGVIEKGPHLAAAATGE